MLKKTITFEDAFTEEQTTQDFYFHLTKADIVRIIGRDRTGDWERYVSEIANSGDSDRIMDFIENIVRDAVGRRTPEGLFVKNKDEAAGFISSDAYGELFVELIQEPKKMEEFMQGVIGKSKIQKAELESGVKSVTKGRTTKKK